MFKRGKTQTRATLRGLWMATLFALPHFALAQNLGNAADTVSTPSFSWSGDTTTGVWHPAASTIGLSTGGTERLRINSSGSVGIGTTNPARLLSVGGAARFSPVAAPASPAAGDFYIDSAAANTLKYHNGSSWVSVSGGAVSFPLLATPTGSAAAPAYSFTGTDSDTGMYRPAADALGFSTAGAERIAVSSTGVVSIAQKLIAPDGSIASPGIGFTGNNNTGFYHSAGYVGIAVNGLYRGLIGDAGMESYSDQNYNAYKSFSFGLNGGNQAFPSFIGIYSRGNPGTPAHPQQYDMLGNFEGRSYLTSGNSAGGMQVRAEATFNGVSQPTYTALFTTPTGSLASLERLRISSGGNVGIGTSTPEARLHVAGDLKLGNSAAACNGTTEGSQRYNTTGKRMEFCDGANWQSIGTPSGAVEAFAQATCPAGWLQTNGAAVSRTTYASLFTALSTNYGAGDGSTTFNLPDYRGQFLRGWSNASGSDPDAASRTNRGDGTTGDNVGTKQAGQIQSHTHTETNAYFGGIDGATGGGATYFYANSTIATGSAGGNETRPKNVNVLYCIKQ